MKFWEHFFYITLPMAVYPSRDLFYAKVSTSRSAWKWVHRKVLRNWKDCELHHFVGDFCIFKVHTSNSNFQICWSMKILLWSVNTNQDWILITSKNSEIVVTNQFHLCSGSFPWNIQLQVITYEKSCHISVIECQLLIKYWSTKCPFLLYISFKVSTPS